MDQRGWLDAAEFEDAIAACNLLPGPASTELAIFCAWRVRGRLGAVVGGLAFIVPGLIVILVLVGAVPGGRAAAVGPRRGRGRGRRRRSGRGAGRVDPADAELEARLGPGAGPRLPPALGGLPAGGRGRLGHHRALAGAGPARLRRAGAGAAAGCLAAPTIVPVLAPLFPATLSAGVLASVAWVAFKVGALSFGGGFVIIPLMHADAVGRGWMTNAQFLNAVALGQITPGPVVQTVAAVGYAAAGLPGGLLAAVVAFSPSFAFVLGGGRYFSRLRESRAAQAFLDGAGPAAIGAIFGAAVLLARALSVGWQFAVLAGAAGGTAGAAPRRGPDLAQRGRRGPDRRPRRRPAARLRVVSLERRGGRAGGFGAERRAMIRSAGRESAP